MQNISLRITKMDYDLRSFLDNKVIEEYFFVEEVGTLTNKTHYQGYFTTSVTLQTIRNKLKVVDKTLMGNQHFSLSKVKDLQDYSRYLCKGNDNETPPKVVFNNTNWDVAELNAEYWKIKSQRKAKTVFGRMFEGTNPDQFLGEYDTGLSKDKVIDYIFDWLLQNSRVINRSQVQNYMETYMITHDDTYRQQYRRYIRQKIKNFDINDS